MSSAFIHCVRPVLILQRAPRNLSCSLVLTDPHSPDPFRVDGTIVNQRRASQTLSAARRPAPMVVPPTTAASGSFMRSAHAALIPLSRGTRASSKPHPSASPPAPSPVLSGAAASSSARSPSPRWASVRWSSTASSFASCSRLIPLLFTHKPRFNPSEWRTLLFCALPRNPAPVPYSVFRPQPHHCLPRLTDGRHPCPSFLPWPRPSSPTSAWTLPAGSSSRRLHHRRSIKSPLALATPRPHTPANQRPPSPATFLLCSRSSSRSAGSCSTST